MVHDLLYDTERVLLKSYCYLSQPGEYVSATVAPHPAPPAAPAAPDPTLSLLFSETRSQNTEVKISVARMSDKIDTLVSKVSLKVNFMFPKVESRMENRPDYYKRWRD